MLLALAFVQAAAMTPATGATPAAAMTPAAGTPEPSSPAHPAGSRTIGIKLLDAPESRRADPRAHAYIIDHLAPGSTIERRVEVTNESSTPIHVNVYAAAAAIANGTFTFAPQRTPDELTGWTSLDTADLELAASETARVHATIQVPRDAAAGERYGVIWAQTGIGTDRSHTLTMLGRVGVRMYIDVGPGGEPPSDFTIGRLSVSRARDGRAEVRARIQNTGGRALDINGALALSDGPAGLRAGPFPAAETDTALAPGDHAEAVVPLDAQLPAGPWTVALTFNSGLVERTTRATITFPAASGGAGTVAAAAVGQGRFPSPVVAGLSVLVLAAVCLPLSTFLRRRR